MAYQLNKAVRATSLAKVLGLELLGSDIDVTHVAAMDSATPGCLMFDTQVGSDAKPGVLSIKSVAIEGGKQAGPLLLSEHPRRDFIRALDYLNEHGGFRTYDFDSFIHPSVKLGQNVVIERGCRIDEGVVIEHNVVVQSGTTIGAFSRIRTGSCIGGDGFGFERFDKPLRFVHLGGVRIGSHVEIGALNSVVRGSLGDTVIGDHVKTDNLVHIAHNCRIASGVFITACAELSGGVEVGEDAWIGPNASLMQKVKIGGGSLIGLGAVVVKDVEEYSVYAGNPAKQFRKLEKNKT